MNDKLKEAVNRLKIRSDIQLVGDLGIVYDIAERYLSGELVAKTVSQIRKRDEEIKRLSQAIDELHRSWENEHKRNKDLIQDNKKLLVEVEKLKNVYEMSNVWIGNMQLTEHEHQCNVYETRIAGLKTEIDGLKTARIAYASEFDNDADGNPDVGSIHQNIRRLKAEVEKLKSQTLKPLEVEAVDKVIKFCIIKDTSGKVIESANPFIIAEAICARFGQGRLLSVEEIKDIVTNFYPAFEGEDGRMVKDNTVKAIYQAQQDKMKGSE